jgi:hypothetical protein
MRYVYPIPGELLWWASVVHVAAGVLLALSPLSEHGSMKGRAMIAACVIGGVVILGARVWAAWVRGITPGGGAPGAGF